MVSSFLRFLDHTQRRTTVGRIPLDEWSARRRDLYLTTHDTHNRQTSMPSVGFEPTISAGERPQTYALDRAATGTGISIHFESVIHYPTVWRYITCTLSNKPQNVCLFAYTCWSMVSGDGEDNNGGWFFFPRLVSLLIILNINCLRFNKAKLRCMAWWYTRKWGCNITHS